MVYELYTWPNCEDCDKIKNFLEEKNIPYQKIDACAREGSKAFGRIYTQIDSKLERTLKGKIIFPIFVEVEKNVEGKEAKVVRFAQKSEKIKVLFE